MRIPMAFGVYDGLPKAQNGVGDPAILVDKKTGTIWIVAAWTHGMGCLLYTSTSSVERTLLFA